MAQGKGFRAPARLNRFDGRHRGLMIFLGGTRLTSSRFKFTNIRPPEDCHSHIESLPNITINLAYPPPHGVCHGVSFVYPVEGYFDDIL